MVNPKDTMSYLRHFQYCSQRDLTKFTPFLVDGKQLGWVMKELAKILSDNFDFFELHEKNPLPLVGRVREGGAQLENKVQTVNFPPSLTPPPLTPPTRGGELWLSPHLDTFDKRSAALAEVVAKISKGYGVVLRKEMYPVINEWGDEPLAQIDRAAVPWFGVKGFGVHINGFTRKNGEIHLWIGERAKDREVDPDKLDNMIAGGQPIGLTLEENVIKEAHEEAGIEAALAKTARPVGKLAYMLERMRGLRNDVLFLYDLELPPDIIPRNTDGEVRAFHLMSLPEVADIIRTTNRFKFNCNLVIIDFLMRHGFLNERHEEFKEIKVFLEK